MLGLADEPAGADADADGDADDELIETVASFKKNKQVLRQSTTVKQSCMVLY